MAKLDPIIHQPIRLKIMAALTTLPDDAQMDFTALRTAADATDGNLSVHLRKLEAVGYITAAKSFYGRKPRTYLAVTPLGRKAFADHVRALQTIIDSSASSA